MIKKLNFSQYSSSGIRRYLNNKNLFVEYNHLWRFIRNIEHATMSVSQREKSLEPLSPVVASILEGITDEIRDVRRNRLRLLFRGYSTKILYMHRSLKRIQHLFRSSEGIDINKWEFTYLRNLVDYIDRYVYDEERYFDKLDVNEYIEERIDPTIIYFNDKTLSASILFMCFSIVQIVFSALIPVALLIPADTDNTTIVGALYGALLTISSGIIALCKFKEKWIQYHELRDKLFKERNVYISDLSRKDRDYAEFVNVCEKIISLEHKNLTEFLSNIDTPAKKKLKVDDE